MTLEERERAPPTAINVISGDDTTAQAPPPQPVWDPVLQIYVGGIVPENAKVQELMEQSDGYLRVFGYGSLCWNPGTEDGALAHPSVKKTLGRARGYRRCWAQKSTDHRGNPSFPGIVCTLLKDEEFRLFRKRNDRSKDHDVDGGKEEEPSLTEGLLYELPPELVEKCLKELDFREKGGYARDVIEVIEDESGKVVQALLYRGTPDNPAFWPRALQDLPFAAAIMSVAIGPSGENRIYLEQLDAFLEHTACPQALAKFDDTFALTSMVRQLHDKNKNVQLFFLFGSGSNQYNQLFLGQRSSNRCSSDDSCTTPDNNRVNGGDVVVSEGGGGDDAHDMTEIVACVSPIPLQTVAHTETNTDTAAAGLVAVDGIRINDGTQVTGDDEQEEEGGNMAVKLFAGGGHSGLLTKNGRLFLFGWNESGQLGTSTTTSDFLGQQSDASSSTAANKLLLPVLSELPGIRVSDASLGFSHSLIIEKNTGKLFSFGDNSKGQVDGMPSSTTSGRVHHHHHVPSPITPVWAEKDRIVSVAAGIFHSAAVTAKGELLRFGCQRSSGLVDATTEKVKNNSNNNNNDDNTDFVVGRWRPDDGSKIVRVACGRRHTIALDDQGRVWSVGDNKYGQLGRSMPNTRDHCATAPCLVEIMSKETSPGEVVETISCGWSHTVVMSRCADGTTKVYGWGRNDKGQLGTREATTDKVERPTLLFTSHNVRSVSCGSESTVVLDENDEIWSCGWNEHGNLATADTQDRWELSKAVGATIVRAPGYPNTATTCIAAGGSHLLAMKVWPTGTV